MRKYGFCLVTFSLCLLVLSGCGKLERKGPEPANSPPTVGFANIPPESTYFSVNPLIHWYGTDVDGFVTAFQYSVIRKDGLLDFGGLDELKSYLHGIPSDSVSWVDQTHLKNMTGVHVVAEPHGHERNVSMYADMDPEIYTPQYILVRCVDNRGAVSEVISRLFYRNNHRPEAFFDKEALGLSPDDDLDTFALVSYCLAETTITWKGIKVSWYGLDTADYPDRNSQPEFEFKWDLVGPFANILDMDSTKVVRYSQRCDTISGVEICSRWVSDQSYVFRNLENFPGLGYGYYQLRLRTRDDASVSHEAPAKLTLRTLKPQFRYDDQGIGTVLLVDATRYGGQTGGPVGSPTEESDTAFVRGFYETGLRRLRDQGVYEEFGMWHDVTIPSYGGGKSAPPVDTLARYDLVIVANVGSVPDITEEQFGDYRRYLNVGGRVWVIGMNNFNFQTGRNPIEAASSNAHRFGADYCGIQAVFVPGWSSLDSMTLGFVQAIPFGDWDQHLSVLSADTTKCKRLIDYKPNDAFQQWGVRGIPWVTFVAMSNNPDWAFRVPAERRILSFGSYYGSISPMHDRPCGVNYIGPTFRTALFTFPLNLMQNEEQDDFPAYLVMEEVIRWFMEDRP